MRRFLSTNKVSVLLYIFTIFIDVEYAKAQVLPARSEIKKLHQQYLGFDINNKSLDSLLVEIRNAGVFVFDTIIPKSKQQNFYSRAYSSSFNPFSIKGKCELQITESRLVGGSSGLTGLQFQIILLPVNTDNLLLKLKKEYKTLADEWGKLFKPISTKNKKRKDKQPYDSFTFASAGGGSVTVGWGPYYKAPEAIVISVAFFHLISTQ
jgi:hypothetical protein